MAAALTLPPPHWQTSRGAGWKRGISTKYRKVSNGLSVLCHAQVTALTSTDSRNIPACYRLASIRGSGSCSFGALTAKVPSVLGESGLSRS